ncbi:hypothetical protein IGB42_03770 [Andreprevotia sp. IGB-42]|uniref:HEAT repeat domain-containing protein n=1 Tax=Andreprevotia sp. IGB-42 TaxID=2497473 RepID=UPI001359D38C|nr:HEAT repeat domain-containing protein [Andreprevotia sp. IGB-42]KAF0811753.1 hypothetical protein IGB42_03770 [Andreprevotia sp. IGB-42]
MPLKKSAVSATSSPSLPPVLAVPAGQDLFRLAEQLAHTADRAQREAMLLTLIRAGDADIAEHLISLLPAADVTLRNELLDALRDMDDVASLPAARLLNNPDVNLRIYALSILENARDPALGDWLAGLLGYETEINVCATAVEILSEVGSSSHVPLLKTLKLRFPQSPFMAAVVDAAVARLDGDD